jgi:methionyl-tRNA formyltransferase
MRIVFLGTGAFGVPALHALRAAGHDVLRAVSQPDRPVGRGRGVQPTPMHAAADAAGVPHVQTENVDALPLDEVAGRAEIGVVAAFGQKIGAELLAAFPRGCVNIHASLLPRYRGAAPFQRAVIAGESVTGVTVFQLDQRWDAGAIWGQRETPIGEEETADELHDRLAQLGAELIVQILEDVAAGRAQPIEQDPAQATRAPKLTKADGALDWARPARQVVRNIHGLWSWPAATCILQRGARRERLLIARARVVDQDASPREDCPPGAFHADGTVQASPGRVQLLEVKPAGKRLMPFDAFARGARIAPPDRLLHVDAE